MDGATTSTLTKRVTMSIMFVARQVAVAAAGVCALSSHAAQYVLQAPNWGASQAAAVAAAGGQVRFAHASGVAVVESDRAGFLSDVLARGAITSGAADMVRQFTPSVRTVEMSVEEQAIPNPGNDRYFSTVQWAPQSVRAPQAWAMGYTGKGVRVAVIDGGIHGAHPDLAANVDTAAARSFATSLTPGLGGCSATSWNCDTGTFWHGTHVAGIVAAPANGIGVVGIAPEATIVPVKALHAGSGSFGSVIQAILYAATDGRADIINMSLGAAFPRGSRDAAELVSAMNKAVNFASNKGVLVISSAGNDATDFDHSGNLIDTPAQSGNGLAISATGPFGFAYGDKSFARFSSYSNWGHSIVSLAAPGGDFAWPTDELCTLPTTGGAPVTIPCWAFDMVLSTSRGSLASAGSYTWSAGTSMSAPAASAVAALIKQKHPGASVGDLKNRLRRATDDLGKPGNDPFYGAGYLNAEKAVTQ
jgi:lantibiotic leader peptide-processing serine protease